MEILQNALPCLPFKTFPSNSSLTGDYVQLLKGNNNGCNSHVGRQGGRQIINLQSPGCINIGTVTHELCHALGLHHEHNRYDRDDYISIEWENIIPGKICANYVA